MSSVFYGIKRAGLTNMTMTMCRRGVGGALMGRVMEEAERRAVRSVYAYVRGDNKVGLSVTSLPQR